MPRSRTSGLRPRTLRVAIIAGTLLGVIASMAGPAIGATPVTGETPIPNTSAPAGRLGLEVGCAVMTIDLSPAQVRPNVLASETCGRYSWAPDGSLLAYSVNGDLRVVRSDGSGDTSIATGLGEDVFPSAWSPDLAYVGSSACSGRKCSESQQAIVAVDGSGSVTVPGLPRWSPDGSRVAMYPYDPEYLLAGPQLLIGAADGSDLTDIIERGADGRPTGDWSTFGIDRAGWPTWSPDGSVLTFVGWGPKPDHSGELFLVKPDGSGLRRLTPGARDVYGPIWSPDGTRVAFMEGVYADGPTTALSVVDVPTGTISTPVLWKGGVSQVDAVSWSPDGTMLAFGLPEFSEPPTSELHVVTVNGSADWTIRDGHAAAWSPDGQWLAVAGVDGRVFLSRPDGSEVVEVYGSGDEPAGWGPPVWLGYTAPETTWTPDGSRSEQLAPASSEPAKATDDPGAPAAAAMYTDSTGLIAFARNGEIRTLDPATGDERLVLAEPGVETSPMFWSQDGRFIIFWDGAGAVTPDGGALFRTFDRQGAGPASWAPRADRYARLAQTPRGPTIEIHDAAGKVIDAVDVSPPVDGAGGLAWAPDGTRLALVAMTCKGEICTCTTKRCAATATGDTTSSVWVVKLDGSAPLLLAERTGVIPEASSDVYLPQMPWSPDGEHLAWQETSCRERVCSEALVIADAMGSRDPVVLDDVWFDSWSPDGRSIAFNVYSEEEPSRNGIYLMDVDGGHQRQITAGGDVLPVWSGDGGWLAFTRPGDGRTEDGSVRNLDVWVIRTDGTEAHRVITGTNNFDWQHPAVIE